MGTEKEPTYEALPYGTVLEHPGIRGVTYMVVGDAPTRGFPPFTNLNAAVLADPMTRGKQRLGDLVVISGQKERHGKLTGYEWIVLDDPRDD